MWLTSHAAMKARHASAVTEHCMLASCSKCQLLHQLVPCGQQPCELSQLLVLVFRQQGHLRKVRQIQFFEMTVLAKYQDKQYKIVLQWKSWLTVSSEILHR